MNQSSQGNACCPLPAECVNCLGTWLAILTFWDNKSKNCACCWLGCSQVSKIITASNQKQTKQLHALSLTSSMCSCMDARARSIRVKCPCLRRAPRYVWSTGSCASTRHRRAERTGKRCCCSFCCWFHGGRGGSSQSPSSHAETVWDSFTPRSGMRIWTGECPGDNYASKRSTVPLLVILPPQRK